MENSNKLLNLTQTVSEKKILKVKKQ